MKNPEDFLPLSQPTYYTLVGLTREPMHGYRLQQEIKELSDEQVKVSLNNLYVLLRRMENDGLIHHIDRNNLEDYSDNTNDGRKTKPYEISELGESVLVAEVARLRRMLNASVNINNDLNESLDRLI